MRGLPPFLVSPSVTTSLERLRSSEGRPSRVEDLRLLPGTLTCCVRHRKEFVIVDGARCRVAADPTDLGRVIDELVTLAESLPRDNVAH
jgi:hypothetical protein